MYLSDNETATDLLYYESVAITVAKLIRDNVEKPISIGVHGDWGAGKSSVLEMIKATFKEDEKTLCITFNGWVFQGFEDAKVVLVEDIVHELLGARSVTAKLKTAASNVLKRIRWLKVLKKVGGTAITVGTAVATGVPIVPISQEKDTEGYIKPEDVPSVPDQMHEFRKEFEEMLKEAKIERLVVLVDDLDRCLPDTVIQTLEAIRLFLFVPKSAFVIAADETMVEYAVRKHFPDLSTTPGQGAYSRNYLEKLIQVPFRIPALGLSETRTYVTLLLIQSETGETNADFLKVLGAAKNQLKRPWTSRGLERGVIAKAIGNTIPDSIEQAIHLAEQIGGVLGKGTKGNPRQIKRFLNSMALRLAIAEARGFSDEIDKSVLAKLMLVERFASDFYDEVSRDAGLAVDGESVLLQELEKGVTGSKKKESIEGAKKWAENEWVKEWIALKPSLSSIDLRPYLFITRDKKTYLGGATLSGELEEVVEILSSTSRMAIRKLEPKLASLENAEAVELFETLRARILEADDFGPPPPGVDGLSVLVKKRPHLQAALLDFLGSLPIENIGGWAVTAWGECFTEESEAEFKNVVSKWAEQDDNVALQTVAKHELEL